MARQSRKAARAAMRLRARELLKRRRLLTWLLPAFGAFALWGSTRLMAARAASKGQKAAAEPLTQSRRAAPRLHFAKTFDVTAFMRGNLHTHTTLSDGNSTPERTIGWYVAHDYRFLALTDHNLLSEPARYVSLHDPEFVLIPGEEITMLGAGRQVHVNALCTHTRIPGGAFPTASVALSNAISRVLAQGGVALVNHPNFDWGLTPADVIDARDAPLLEIASGHPYVHTAGNATHPSHEELWDLALTAGADYMGVAVDDVHRIDTSGNPLALPGKGWVEVFGNVADSKFICSALAQGRLYASTGVELRRIAVTETDYIVEPARSDAVVVFLGAGGRELARATAGMAGAPPSYSLQGNEGYVRARIEGPHTARAWTPAVRVVVGPN